MITRLLAPTMALCLGLLLGSCGSFSGYVADHWPHWAGGEPDDVPPRPGAPGYEEFIAHGQANQANKDSTTAGAAPANGNTTNVQAVANPAAAAAAAIPTNVQSAAPSANPPADNRATVEGGLY